MRRVTVLLPLLLLAFVGACMNTVPTPVQETGKLNLQGTELFTVVDTNARNMISCTGLIQRTLPNGKLEVICNVKSREAVSLEVQVQCVFLEEIGTGIAEETTWRAFTLPELATETVRFTSTRPGLRFCTLRARLGQRQ